MPKQLPSGKVCPTPVAGPDLIPTFFQFAGINLPWKMHGRDLTPLLKKPETRWKQPCLMVNTGRIYGSDTAAVPTDPKVLYGGGIPWWVSIHDGRYKYIRSLVKGEFEELYDLDVDPDELTNLALVAKHGNRLNKMRSQTIAELKRTDAGFADRLPPVKAGK